jgi:hypothetical protein
VCWMEGTANEGVGLLHWARAVRDVDGVDGRKWFVFVWKCCHASRKMRSSDDHRVAGRIAVCVRAGGPEELICDIGVIACVETCVSMLVVAFGRGGQWGKKD